MTWHIENKDVMDWAAQYDGPKFHAMFADPPYHLHDGKGRGGFMGREWDGAHDISFRPETWTALAEHLHPGAFILAFASSRGWHRLACAMEDAGLVLQPSIFVNGMVIDVPLCLGWATGQAMPKATRLDKKLDEIAGAKGKIIGKRVYADGTTAHMNKRGGHEGWDRPWMAGPEENKGALWDTVPATPLARAWQGHRYGGQILRDALTPIIVCQKPWTGKRLDCIVETGAGAINVDGGRIAAGQDYDEAGWGPRYGETSMPNMGGHQTRPWVQDAIAEGKPVKDSQPSPRGRWPQNLILVHTEFCQRVGERKVKNVSGNVSGNEPSQRGDEGTAYYDKRGRMSFEKYGGIDGLETVATWRCLIACPECGHTWLAVDKEICPECKTTGEWICSVRRLGEQSGERGGKWGRQGKTNSSKMPFSDTPKGQEYLVRSEQYRNNTGTATRFFFNADWSYEIAERLAMADPVHYCPKSSRRERDAGLLGAMPCVKCSKLNSRTHLNDKGEEVPCRRNGHETIKPLTLTRYLATLLLPPPEYAPRRILIPFFGVGSEGIGAMLAGFEEIVGIEMDAEYCTIGEARMKYWAPRPEQMRLF